MDKQDKLAELIKDIRVAMLSTVAEDGSIHSRPMATANTDHFDGTLWFFTDIDSAKVFEVRQDSHVNVSYSDPGTNTYVSVSGTAMLSRDRQKATELWSPAMKAWFPEGTSDPKLALLRVDVSRAEYWDQPSSKIVHLVGLAKATLTGQRYEPGDHQQIDMRQ